MVPRVQVEAKLPSGGGANGEYYKVSSTGGISGVYDAAGFGSTPGFNTLDSHNQHLGAQY